MTVAVLEQRPPPFQEIFGRQPGTFAGSVAIAPWEWRYFLGSPPTSSQPGLRNGATTPSVTGASITSIRLEPTIQIIPPGRSDDEIPYALSEIRRLTGWSWNRVSQALGKTRQAIHRWTLGRKIEQTNAERVARLRATLAYIDLGNAEDNRRLLNRALSDGRTGADLLNEGLFDLVRARLGSDYRTARPRKLAADVPQINVTEHWFDRLIAMEGTEVRPTIIPAPGRSRSVTVRRR
ncbi:MAG: hypothetical protein WCC64_00615 [Aliidongia sp.]